MMIETMVAVAIAVMVVTLAIWMLPTVGWTLFALAVAGILALVIKLMVDGKRALCAAREKLDAVAGDGDLRFSLILEGDVVLDGHVIGIDAEKGILGFASTSVASTLPLDAIQHVNARGVTRMGQDKPSWYVIRIDAGRKNGPKLASSDRNRIGGWLAALAGVLGNRVDKSILD